jgi:hypothetical protein
VRLFLFRYLEMESEICQAVNALKMRDSNHEKGLRQYVIGANGVSVGDTLQDLTGLLGWSALRERTNPGNARLRRLRKSAASAPGRRVRGDPLPREPCPGPPPQRRRVNTNLLPC